MLVPEEQLSGSINISGLPAGIYFLKFSGTPSIDQVLKLIVE
jgi:hypothetical protein